MISDAIRMDAYVRALGRAVKPNSVVLDLGTGSGIFALLACRMGARRVYAVEPDAVIQIARELAADNGCADRIEFRQELSTKVTLPERADVIVSDIRGVLPLHRHHLPAIVDARRRLLVPGGAMIPKSDSLWLAIAEAPEMFESAIAPWTSDSHGLDLHAVRRLVTNDWRRAALRFDQLLTPPASCGTLDYATLESPDFRAEVVAAVTRSGIGYGVSVWFDATLDDGIGFSNAPGAPELIYGNAFFHWPEPVRLAAGDAVRVDLVAKLDGDSYVWGWHSVVLNQSDANDVKAEFRQSTFLGKPLPLERLRRTSAGHVPSLNDDGQLDLLILEMMNGRATLDDIARRLLERFPGRFSRWHDALRRVSELSSKYGR